MNLEKAQKLAKKLAAENNSVYAIWQAEAIYQRTDIAHKDRYVVKRYQSYDKYRPGFVQSVSPK
jgi:hypothetical protein